MSSQDSMRDKITKNTSVPIGIVAGLVSAIILTCGFLFAVSAKADSNERRINKIECSIENGFKDMRSEFNVIKDELTNIKVELASRNGVK